MSRHLGKIIDLVKGAKQLDMLDSSKDIEYPEPEKPVVIDENAQDWEKVEDDYDLRKFLVKHKALTENQYIDIVGRRKIGSDWHRYSKDMVENWAKEHNNPTTNDKAYQALKDVEEAEMNNNDADFNSRKLSNVRDSLDNMYQRFNLSSKAFMEAVDSGNVNITKNPQFAKNHLYRMIEKSPENMETYIDHPHFDQRASEMVFSSEDKIKNTPAHAINRLIHNKSDGYSSDGGLRPQDGEPRTKLSPRVIHSILEHGMEKLRPAAMDILLDHADPTFKKQWTDKVLGIFEGEYEHSMPEDYDSEEDFQADNWNNWTEHGFNPSYNRIAHMLAGSRHLDDEQAEHIKRHGEFEEKYELYHNKHVDPRHGVEMFQKWHDDDHEHGYDSDALVEKYREEKDDVLTIDDLSEEQKEEIRQEGYDSGEIDEAAERESDYGDWLYHLDDDKILEYMGSDYDDIDDIHSDLIEGHDWEAPNEESKQNIGNPVFDALDKLHSEYEGQFINPNELKAITNLSPEELGLEVDEDGEIDSDDVKEELDKFGGPAMIDYSNSEDHTIDEHPEYEDRYEDTARQWRLDKWNNDGNFRYEVGDAKYLYEDHRESEEYQQAFENATKEYIEDNAKDHISELYENSHQDTRFIPNHLHAHIPNFAELHEANKRVAADGGHGPFFNQHIKDREYNHSYGEDQHFYEMVKDHAEANGGKIDVGTMNKLYPAQKDKWKKIFAGKGKITHEEATQKLEELPKTNYDVTFGKWKANNMQNINNQNQIIFRLDHSLDSIKPLMDDPELYETFKHVQSVSKRSGHPTNDNTIAWARVDTSDPNHWMIDEVQSDFGKTVTRYLKEQGAEKKADHIDKISAHHKNWRETLINAVLKEAKKHGAQQVSTHSPESKSRHTGSSTIHSVYKDSYKKVPRQMGFSPSEMETLPLTDKGKKSFEGQEIPDKGQETIDEQAGQHETASDWHTKAGDYLSWAKQNKDKVNMADVSDKQFDDMINHHWSRRQGHIERTLNLGKETDGFYDVGEHHGPDHLGAEQSSEKNSLLDSIVTGFGVSHPHDDLIGSEIPEVKPPQKGKDLGGHTFNLTPKLLKKHMDYVIGLYEELEKLEKGEGYRAAKGALLALGLAQGAHMMDGDAKQEAAKQFAQQNAPKHARSVASIEQNYDPVKEGYDEAKREANDIIYRNDKKYFINKYSDGLSPHVYKQTVKNNPELSAKYGYIHNLSNSTFREVAQKNQNLRDDVHSAHYDKLHGEFGGDHEKMLHAWKNGIKSTKDKFRSPASPMLGQQPDQDTIDDTVQDEPNWTHRRAFRGRR